jgi:flagellar M-ring protein FliF
MAGLPEVKEQINQFWHNMDRSLKIKLALALVGSLVLVLALVQITKPRYEVLFANLTPEDAGEITGRLEEINVPYQLAANGTSILVPEAQVYKVRNSLAMEGLPRGGNVDFGIFDETRLGITEFERRVQYRRALQGELTRTITAMAGIKNAWVQISIPEPRLYLSEEEEASAAILLETSGELKPAQIQGIVHLVSHSVEGLEPERVTVVDTRGQVLSQDLGRETGFGLTTSQYEIQRRVERELEQGIQSMLEMVLGHGKVVTRVKVDMNFDQREVTTQLFQPEEDGEGIIRSIQELERSFSGTEGGAGVPGTVTNIPGEGIPTYQGGQEGESEYYEREVTRNYDISEIREHLVVAPGQVERLSVAVIIDEDQLSTEQRVAVEETVAAAVGMDYNRGDQVIVTSLPFAESPFGELEDVVGVERPSWWPWLVYLLIGGAVLAAGIQLYRQRQRRQEEEYRAVQEQAAVAQLEEEPEEVVQRQQVQEQVERLVRQQPETVAQLLSTWMHED